MIRKNPIGRGKIILQMGIVLTWGIMMALLVERTFIKPQALRISPTLAKEGIKSGEEWWGVYWKGEKIGFALTGQEAKGRKIWVKERLWLKLTLLGIPQNVEQALEYQMDENLSLEFFTFSLQSGLFPLQVSGRMEDRAAGQGKTLRMKITSGGREQVQVMNLPETPYLLGQTKLYLLAQGLEKGRRYRIPAFDPTSLRPAEMIAEVEGTETLKIGGEERELYRVRQEFRGIVAKSWMDRNGQIWKEESPMGLALMRESKRMAMHQNWSPGKTADLIALTAIPVNREIPNPRSVRFLRVRLQSASLKGLGIEGDRQRRRGDEIVVRKEEFPPRASDPQGLPWEIKQEALLPTPFIQSDNPEIQHKARTIVEGVKDPAEQVKRIAAWVYKELEKRPVVSIPSALEVLHQMMGDCNEHAVLFTALVRAMGIPARMQAGIIYQEGKFFYHAWAQVYLGSWISVDPTLNQIPADATHLRLVTGDLEPQLDLVKVIGRLKVEVMEVH